MGYHYVVQIHCYPHFNIRHLVWGNKQSQTIALFAYTHHVPGQLVTTANPPYAKQRMYRKI